MVTKWIFPHECLAGLFILSLLLVIFCSVFSLPTPHFLLSPSVHRASYVRPGHFYLVIIKATKAIIAGPDWKSWSLISLLLPSVPRISWRRHWVNGNAGERRHDAGFSCLDARLRGGQQVRRRREGRRRGDARGRRGGRGRGREPGRPGGGASGARSPRPVRPVRAALGLEGAAGGRPLPILSHPSPRPSLPGPERNHPEGCRPPSPPAPLPTGTVSPPRAATGRTAEINRRDPAAVPETRADRERARHPHAWLLGPRAVPVVHARPPAAGSRGARPSPSPPARDAPLRGRRGSGRPGSRPAEAPLPPLALLRSRERPAPSLRRRAGSTTKEGARPAEGASR